MFLTRSDLEEFSHSPVSVLVMGSESALEACQPLAFSLLLRREGAGSPSVLERERIAELRKEAEGLSCPVVQGFAPLCAWCPPHLVLLVASSSLALQCTKRRGCAMLLCPEHRAARVYPQPRFHAKVTNEIKEKEESLGTSWLACFLLGFCKIIAVLVSGSIGFSGLVSLRKTRKDCCSFLHLTGLSPTKAVPIPDRSCMRQSS